MAHPAVCVLTLLFAVTTCGLSLIVIYCNVDFEFVAICENTLAAVTTGWSYLALMPFGDVPFNSIAWNWGSTTINTITFITVIVPTIVQLMISIMVSNILRYAYIFIYKSYKLTYDIYDVPVHVQNQLTKYYDKIWNHCGGYNEDLGFFNIGCNPALAKEIRLDVSWPVFQHSRMFRDFDMYFLLQVSEVVNQRSLVAGEYVYKKGEIKHKMVYVVNGTIDLFSETDAECAIMSLTQGTCIGEASLIMSYKSNNTVQCKTFCELLVIKRKDFIKVMKRIPNRGRFIRKMIENRIKSARNLKYLADRARSNLANTSASKDTYTVLWLKQTLHKLMSVDEDSARKHELQNVYLLQRMDETIFDPLLFTAEYLDMLSITARYETEMDAVFVKSTFPYVFHPDSIVIILYKFIVVIAILFACFWIPQKAFLDIHYSNKSDFFPSLIITTIFCVDVLLQLSTAIPSRNGILANTSMIVLYKVKTFCFWTDVAASIPLETFASLIVHDSNVKYSAMLRLNRLLKIYNLSILFTDWEKKFNANTVMLRYVRQYSVHFYTIYLVYCVMQYLYPDFDTEFLLFTTSLLSVRSKNKDAEFLNSDIALFIIVSLAFSALFITKIVYISTAIVMANLNRLYAQQICHDVFAKITMSKLPEIHKLRTVRYLQLQYEENMGINIRTEFYYLMKMPKSLHNNTMDAITSDLWQHVTFFADFLEEVTDDLYPIMSLVTLPANEVIVYRGDYFKKCYIKYTGIIEILDQFGNVMTQENQSTFRVINLVTSLLDAPSLFTMRTITVNRCIVFRIEDLLLAMHRHPKLKEILRRTIAECSDVAKRFMELAAIETNSVAPPLTLPPKKNVHVFSYNLKPDSPEEYDYHIPYDRLYPFTFIRVLLLRKTIYPDSNFLFIWESFRSCFAILSAILYMMPPVFNTPYLKSILIFLDVMAFIDIYVRMHTCYYRSDGILIVHPLMTAKHYFAHGFLLDLVAVFPIGVLSTPATAASYFATYAPKLLQLHRYISFMYILQIKSLTAVRSIFMISYIPILLVIGNAFGSFIIHSECSFGVYLGTELPPNIICFNDSIIEMSNFHKPMTPLMGQAVALYIGISFVTTSGWQNFVVLRDATRIRVAILALLGQFLLVSCVGYVITHFIYRHGLLIDYQHAMRELLDFMKLIKVSKELRKYTITCCEDQWTLLKGKPLQVVIAQLHTPLQMDILYDSYGVRAYDTSAFSTKCVLFYRNLLAVSTYEIVVKNGYIATINDTKTTLAIILRGTMDVVAPDGMVMSTLYPGAIMGNLENRKWSRVKVSVVANCHVEVLVIKSARFHYVLNRFKKIKAEFKLLRKRYVHYIPSLTRTLRDDDEEEYYEPKRKLIFTKTYHPESFGIKVWSTAQLLFPCYFGILLDFFQMSTGNHNSWIVICQYCCDALFAVHFVLRNRIAYVNNYGVLVRDPKKIKERNRKNKLKYWLTFFSLIPFDLLTFVLPIEYGSTKTLYAVLRTNRLIRLSYVYEFFAMVNAKLNTNIYVVRFGFIIVWASLVLCGMGAVIGVVSCNLEVNIEPHIPICRELHEMETTEMVRLHSKFTRVALLSLTQTSQYVYSPQHPLTAILFALLLLLSHSLWAIIIGQIFAAIMEVNATHLTFKMIRERLEFYCTSQDMDSSLMGRMCTYTNFLWFHYKGVQFPQMLVVLSPYLKDVVHESCCHKYFANHPVFRDCHPDFVRQVIRKVTFRMFSNMGYVQFKDNVEGALFFIYQGKIHVISDMFKNEIVALLEPGHAFGVLQGIFGDKTYPYSYRSVGSTVVVVLQHRDWRHLLDFYPASRYILYNRCQDYMGY